MTCEDRDPGDEDQLRPDCRKVAAMGTTEQRPEPLTPGQVEALRAWVALAPPDTVLPRIVATIDAYREALGLLLLGVAERPDGFGYPAKHGRDVVERARRLVEG